jgi:hypothetical protein
LQQLLLVFGMNRADATVNGTPLSHEIDSVSYSVAFGTPHKSASAHGFIDLGTVTPLVWRQCHHRLVDIGRDSQRVIERGGNGGGAAPNGGVGFFQTTTRHGRTANVEGLKILRKILQAPALAPYVVEEVDPGAKV